MTDITVLGSTGSIGTQTLEIVRQAPGAYRVRALAAGTSVDLVVAQAKEFQPDAVVVADAETAALVAAQLPGIDVDHGPAALAAAATMGQIAINGIVGFAGLPVTLAVLNAGQRLGLANKESLIAAGPVVQLARATPGAEIIPVDSEHCAVHQCLRANSNADRVDQIVLTASGGPFRGRSAAELADVTIADALAHPTWSMGPKITVDSSTLMNKGLEVIEANELFGVGFDHIDVVVHPQSIVHSMVSFSDGATIAQLSMPDMRLCIGYALAYPDRLETEFGTMDWSKGHSLTFEAPDRVAFPCLRLAEEAGRSGETAPAWLSAANEIAVEAFLDQKLSWAAIAEVVDATLQQWDGIKATSADVVLQADATARARARTIINQKAAA